MISKNWDLVEAQMKVQEWYDKLKIAYNNSAWDDLKDLYNDFSLIYDRKNKMAYQGKDRIEKFYKTQKNSGRLIMARVTVTVFAVQDVEAIIRFGDVFKHIIQRAYWNTSVKFKFKTGKLVSDPISGDGDHMDLCWLNNPNFEIHG